jgi:hypothetical protein
MKRALILLLLMTTIFSAKAQKSLAQFDFLLGNWEMKTTKGKTTEHWVKSKDSLNGKSYKHNLKGESVLQETVVIKKIKGDFYFCVTGAGNKDRVDFKLISSDRDKLIFENKQHDFPQRIIYTNKSKNELFAYIEGIINGKETKIEFPYQRTRN